MVHLYKRICRHCSKTYEVNRKQLSCSYAAIFCSKECKIMQSKHWREAYKEAIKIHSDTTDKSVIKLEAQRIMNIPSTIFSRIELERELLKKMVYEWDNSIFEKSLNCYTLNDAVKYVINGK